MWLVDQIGPTGQGFFDLWSVAQLIFWSVIASLLWAYNQRRLQGLRAYSDCWVSDFFACIGFSYAWEIIERPLEKIFPQIWRCPESALNSWVSDPLFCAVAILLTWFVLNRRYVPRKP